MLNDVERAEMERGFYIIQSVTCWRGVNEKCET